METSNKKTKWTQYWFVVRELTGREIKRKYSRSKLGILWSVLSPLINMAIVSFIFSYMFNRMVENFAIYYWVGQIIFNLFSEGTSTSMSALVDNKFYLINLKIPMRVFVMSRVYTALVNLGYSLIAFIPLMFVFKIHLTWHIVLMIPIVIMFLIFILGVSYLLSVACTFFGDITHLYSIFITMLMFMSAVFYPLDGLNGVAQKVVSLNPVYQFIDAARHVMYMNQVPSMEKMLTLALCSLLVYLIGVQIFNNNKNRIAQKL